MSTLTLHTRHMWYRTWGFPALQIDDNDMRLGAQIMFADDASNEKLMADALECFQYQGVAVGTRRDNEPSDFEALYAFKLPDRMRTFTLTCRETDTPNVPPDGYRTLGDMLKVMSGLPEPMHKSHLDEYANSPTKIYHYCDGMMREVKQVGETAFELAWVR